MSSYAYVPCTASSLVTLSRRSSLKSLQSRLHECWIRTVASASTLWTVRNGQGSAGTARHAKSGGLIVQWVPLPRLFSARKILYPRLYDVSRMHERLVLMDS